MLGNKFQWYQSDHKIIYSGKINPGLIVYNGLLVSTKYSRIKVPIISYKMIDSIPILFRWYNRRWRYHETYRNIQENFINGTQLSVRSINAYFFTFAESWIWWKLTVFEVGRESKGNFIKRIILHKNDNFYQ